MRSEENVIVRGENSESAEERSAIRAVNKAAFGGSEEADLVDKARADGDALISLVAKLEDQIVGHTLFSRMGIEHCGARVRKSSSLSDTPIIIRASVSRQRRHGQSKARSPAQNPSLRHPGWRRSWLPSTTGSVTAGKQ